MVSDFFVVSVRSLFYPFFAFPAPDDLPPGAAHATQGKLALHVDVTERVGQVVEEGFGGTGGARLGLGLTVEQVAGKLQLTTERQVGHQQGKIRQQLPGVGPADVVERTDAQRGAKPDDGRTTAEHVAGAVVGLEGQRALLLEPERQGVVDKLDRLGAAGLTQRLDVLVEVSPQHLGQGLHTGHAGPELVGDGGKAHARDEAVFNIAEKVAHLLGRAQGQEVVVDGQHGRVRRIADVVLPVEGIVEGIAVDVALFAPGTGLVGLADGVELLHKGEEVLALGAVEALQELGHRNGSRHQTDFDAGLPGGFSLLFRKRSAARYCRSTLRAMASSAARLAVRSCTMRRMNDLPLAWPAEMTVMNEGLWSSPSR